MKNDLLNNSSKIVLMVMLLPLTLFCQIKMGDHPQEINPYAIFEIESSKQGVLLPRMSTSERNTAFQSEIPNGLLIFNTDEDCLQWYSEKNSLWNCITSQFTVENNQLLWEDQVVINFDDYLDNTDAQQLQLEGTILRLESGGAVDLSVLIPENRVQKLSLEGTLLTLENGGSVDLAPLLVPSSNPKIDRFQLVSNTLEISLENDNVPPLQLSLNPLLKDEQKLSLSSSTLSLERGGNVDLSGFAIDLDEQKLAFSQLNSTTVQLSISKGNSLEWRSDGWVAFSTPNSNTLSLSLAKDFNSQGTFSSTASITSNQKEDWGNNHFVFGSPQLDNDPSSLEDNKRFFFNKKKAAFRAGFAQSDQWDNKNVGTYSMALGRNTVASGYHATAFGLSTLSDGWYTTAMGQGTIAESHSETALGRYNTQNNALISSSAWEPNDRLVVIGNGTGSSTASRSDALIMYKNGNTTVSGVWSGPGFVTLSDVRLKQNIAPLEVEIHKLMQLKTYQYQLINQPEKVLHYGLLADEVAQIFPNLVHSLTPENELKGLNYMELIPVLIQMVQKQQEQINVLENKIAQWHASSVKQFRRNY
ncbi:tail fiber domain-containing protein [Flavobacteriaceae bacterium]|nr:tail fiber domain-containing protein [Flavobacteriaceae bacterium]